MVTVFETTDPLIVGAVKGVLQGADIPFYVICEDLGIGYGPIGIRADAPNRIQVGADRESQVRQLLAPFEDDAPGHTDDQ